MNFLNRNHPNFRVSTVITVNCNLPKITYPTFRSLLLLRIYQSIYLRRDVDVTNYLIVNPNFRAEQRNIRLLAPHSILKRVKTATSVATYSSAIALQLGLEAPQIREEIADYLVHFAQHSDSNSWQEDIERLLLRDLTVSATPSGQLVFEFGDRAIARYLQGILTYCLPQTDVAPSQRPSQKYSGNSKIFGCQYSYARCAALIRMQSIPNCIGENVENDCAIWLKNHKLFLTQETALLAQVLTTLDEWEQKPALDLAMALSEAFQQFYRDCQIVKYDTINLQLAQCRLALVMITHWLLKQLLEAGLGVLAPEML